MPGSLPICDVCGRETVKAPTEWFMVHDHLWFSTGLRSHDATLCLGCFEEILGRELRPDDFVAVEANRPCETTSARLLERMGILKMYTDEAGNPLPGHPEEEPTFVRDPPVADDVEWFCATTAARRLGIGLPALFRLVRDGRLMALWHPLRIHRDALDAFVSP